MKHLTEPAAYVETLGEISPERLLEWGIKTLLIDLDNTLVYWKTQDFVPGAKEWIEAMKKAGLECILFTNAKPKRAKAVAEMLDIACVSLAGKPWPIAFLRAGRAVSTDRSRWLSVGDQIFTDVLGANLVGVRAVYVAPASDREWGWTRFVRRLERRLLAQRGR